LPYPAASEFAYSAVRQGASAVRWPAGFDLARERWCRVITILLCVMAGEALAAWTPLTSTPEAAEVS